ncbi:autophagy-related protein 13-domain-containing protein [Gorgonomyces haynaldii]|nr:autophagy-related protein 13-domain-containing protein [Gorgonomyces haynaldii]
MSHMQRSPSNISNSTLSLSRSKSDSLLQQFISKTAQIIVQSRLSTLAKPQQENEKRKTNKWFNLELDEFEPLREQLKFWKGQLTSTAQAPPLIIDILLDISNLSSQHLVLKQGSGTRTRITPEQLIGRDAAGRPVQKQRILHMIPHQPPDIPLVYKQSIAFFRSLYSIVRLLPCYSLTRQLGRPTRSNVEIIYRISSSRVVSPDEAGLDELHVGNDMRRGISEVIFDPVQTPLGVFNLHSTYRLDCEFTIQDNESALSHRFTDLEHNYFHPAQVARRRSSGSLKGSSQSSKPDATGVSIPSASIALGARVESPDHVRYRVESLTTKKNSPSSGPFTPPSLPSSSLPNAAKHLNENLLSKSLLSRQPFQPVPALEYDQPTTVAGTPPFSLNTTSQQLTMVRKPSLTFTTMHQLDLNRPQFFSNSSIYLPGHEDLTRFKQIAKETSEFSESMQSMLTQKTALKAPFQIEEPRKRRSRTSEEEEELLFNMSELDLL